MSVERMPHPTETGAHARKPARSNHMLLPGYYKGPCGTDTNTPKLTVLPADYVVRRPNTKTWPQGDSKACVLGLSSQQCCAARPCKETTASIHKRALRPTQLASLTTGTKSENDASITKRPSNRAVLQRNFSPNGQSISQLPE